MDEERWEGMRWSRKVDGRLMFELNGILRLAGAIMKRINIAWWLFTLFHLFPLL